MKDRIQKRILQASNIIEIIIAILLVITTLGLTFYLVVDLKDMLASGHGVEAFNSFLENVLNIVVGIEFIKMLCQHTLDTVIEVLLFAIARQLIVDHGSSFENLAAIVAIAILFLIKRFWSKAKET